MKTGRKGGWDHATPLVKEDGAWHVVELLEGGEAALGLGPLEELALELELLDVDKVEDDDLGEDVLDRGARDEDDVESAEEGRVDEREVEADVDAVEGVDHRVLHVPPHARAAGGRGGELMLGGAVDG